MRLHLLEKTAYFEQQGQGICVTPHAEPGMRLAQFVLVYWGTCPMTRARVPSVVLVILAPIAMVFLPLQFGIPVAIFSVLLLFFTEMQAAADLLKQTEDNKPRPPEPFDWVKSRPAESELEK